MLSVIKSRVIGRNGNIVVVDFSREPNPPAPRFPGASGLRMPSDDEPRTSFTPLAIRGPLPQVRPPPAPAARLERLGQQQACG